jgi:hypothetical protein
MSNYYFTSTQLLASIKRRCLIPASQSTFSDQDFLDFATEEMNMGVVPTVIQLHEDYYLYETLIPLVNGQIKYQIPYRAIGNKTRDIALVDSNGGYSVMTRIGIGEIATWNFSNSIYAYYIASNEICLVPSDTNTTFNGGFLSVSYYLRPNSLVPDTEVASITSIDRITGIISVSSLPDTFSTNTLLDFIQFKSPHKILSFDVAPLSTDAIGSTITFDLSNIPSSLSVGDKISLATQTCIPQIPSDMHVMLAARVASRLLEAIGDTEGLQNANQKLAELENKTATLINNRVEDSPRRIVSAYGTLRSGLNRRGRGRW